MKFQGTKKTENRFGYNSGATSQNASSWHPRKIPKNSDSGLATTPSSTKLDEDFEMKVLYRVPVNSPNRQQRFHRPNTSIFEVHQATCNRGVREINRDIGLEEGRRYPCESLEATNQLNRYSNVSATASPQNVYTGPLTGDNSKAPSRTNNAGKITFLMKDILNTQKFCFHLYYRFT